MPRGDLPKRTGESSQVTAAWEALGAGALADAHPDGLVVVNREGRIQMLNSQAERMFGYERSQLLGQPVEVLVPAASASRHSTFVASYLASPKSSPMEQGQELSALRRDGSAFAVKIQLCPVETEDGLLVAAVVRDITEQKRQREEKRRLEEQLRQSEKMESIGRLAGGIAHDFNNQLTIILGYGNMLLSSLPAGELQECVREMVRAAERSSSLTRQLLAVSRKLPLDARVLDLNQLIRGLEKMLGRVLREDIELSLKLEDGTYPVLADQGQLEQVVLNLVTNAQDAMPKGGKLTIETACQELDEAYTSSHAEVEPGAYTMLAVHDTGEGMDQETLSHIFDPFFTTKEQGKGTGLGLATVYGMVKQLGGHIWAYSEKGKGSSFKIYLPRTEEERVEPAEEAKPLFCGRGNILLVEDEVAVRKIAVEMLSQLGYEVTAAASGAEAMALVKKGLRCDLLLTDVVMPNMSGRELVERLRKKNPKLRVLYMSGYTDAAMDVHGLLADGTPLLAKPFNLQEIGAKIKQVLEYGGGVAKGRLREGTPLP